MPSDPWLDRFRVTLVGILGAAVAGIAALAFYTSFEAIKAFAARSDGITPQHAWAVPLLVDSFIVVATAADLWFVITRRDRAWWEVLWPKLLLASAATVSFVLNVAHAEPTLAARGVAAIPPAALVLGVELLMMVLRRATSMRAERVQAEYEAQAAQAAEVAEAGELARPPAAGALTRYRPVAVAGPVRPGGDLRLDAPAVGELAAGAAPGGEAGGLPPRDVFGEQERRQAQAAGAEPAPAPELPRRRTDPASVRRRAYRLLFERRPGELRTAEELRSALAGQGTRVDQDTAGRLLREFEAPPKGNPGEAKAAAELLAALTDHGIMVNLRTARRLLRAFDSPGDDPGQARTPEELQATLEAHGLAVDLPAAAHLLRRFDLPRTADRPPALGAAPMRRAAGQPD